MSTSSPAQAEDQFIVTLSEYPEGRGQAVVRPITLGMQPLILIEPSDDQPDGEYSIALDVSLSQLSADEAAEMLRLIAKAIESGIETGIETDTAANGDGVRSDASTQPPPRTGPDCCDTREHGS